MKIRNIYLIGFLLLLCGIIYLSGRLSTREERNRLIDALSASQAQIEYKDTEIAGLRVSVAQTQAMLLTTREALKAEVVSKEELRKLHIRQLNSKTSLILKLEKQLDSIQHTGQIQYDTIYVGVDTIVQPSIVLPFEFGKRTEYTTLTGRFNREGLLSASVETEVPLDIYIGLARRPSENRVIVTTPNPDVTTTHLRSIQIVQPEKRWYERGWVSTTLKVGAGIAIGRATR